MIRPGEAAFNWLLRSYIHSAHKRGYDFNLTADEFRQITSHNCSYCGAVPSSYFKAAKRLNGVYLYNGVDRVDNTIGYTLDNCIPCCETCNRAKRMMSRDEFLAWIARVYEHSVEVTT